MSDAESPVLDLHLSIYQKDFFHPKFIISAMTGIGIVIFLHWSLTFLFLVLTGFTFRNPFDLHVLEWKILWLESMLLIIKAMKAQEGLGIIKCNKVRESE